MSLRVHVPAEFSYKPPQYFFEHTMWHPKIDPNNGKICSYNLVDGWSPKTTVETSLLSIQYLLADPGDITFEGGLNGKAVEQYTSDCDKYIQQAREWVKESNAGYGLMKFEEYHAMCSHRICLHLSDSFDFKFKGYIFCQ